jgi:hypothetical protein
MSGVSVDVNPPSASQADQDFKLAYAGGDDFMSRLQALSKQKAQADASLAALKLGTDAQAALDNAKAALAEAENNKTATAALFAQAEQILELAKSDAADIANKAKVDYDALVAEGRDIRDAAAAVKAEADSDRAAAAAERKALTAERDAAARLAERAEETRMVFESKIAAIHAAIDAAKSDSVGNGNQPTIM